jgi:hypothetical protein
MSEGALSPADREAAVHFMLSADERARLKAEADAAGLTMQQLFELKMLGAAKPRAARGRRRKPSQPEELPYGMTA